MSADAGTDLFKAVRAAILADTYLFGVLGTRVFSSWGNQDAQTPLIRMALPNTRFYEIDGAGEGDEIDLNVHVFTAEDAPIVCRAIAKRVRTILNRANLWLDGANVVAIDYRNTINRQDTADPGLQMAVVQFVAMTTEK